LQDKDEISRIKEAYERRKKEVPVHLYSYFNPSALFISQQREKDLINLLAQYQFNDLSDKRILDTGCGSGGSLMEFLRLGAQPENLHGIDLLSDRIESAKSILPNIDFRCGSAEEIPYPNDMFDIVIQFTVFTSILDMNMKKKIAWEMLRVLKHSGIILWYDYHMDNPKNPDVQGVKKQEIYDLFPNCDIHLNRITLAPPLTRLIAPYSWLLCYLLEKLKILNTHYLGIIQKAHR
jgi:ubiquinone/menaquinone biosynthesis C-methylase UbiE